MKFSSLAFVLVLMAVSNAYAAESCGSKPGQASALPLEKCSDDPVCLERPTATTTNKQIVQDKKVSDSEALARLVFAESISTDFENHPKDCEPKEVFNKIAMGVMSRVHQSPKFGKGIQGVIFQPAQFNPAVSIKSSYSQFFLCPERAGPSWKKYWQMAVAAADAAERAGKEKNPMYRGSITHFYYPHSKQATDPPVDWANLATVKAQIALNREQSFECVNFFSY